MSDPFDENFYIVTATIIPIFFLALTLQGSFYGRLMDKINEGINALAESVGTELSTKSQLKGLLAILISGLAMLIVFGGFAGEIFSLLALYRQSDNIHIKLTVLWSTMGLILLTLAIPAWAVVHAFSKLNATVYQGFMASARLVRRALRERRSKDSAPPSNLQPPGN